MAPPTIAFLPSPTRILEILLFTAVLAGGLLAPSLATAQSPPKESSPSEAPKGPVLELSLKQAVFLALQKNDDLRVEVYNPAIAQTGVTKEEAAFDPNLNLNLQKSRDRLQDTSTFSQNQDTETIQPVKGTAGVSRRFKTGTSVNLDYELESSQAKPKSGELNTTNTSKITLKLTQSLLKNFGVDVNTSKIRIEMKKVETSELDFTNRVLEVVSRVQDQYWTLVQAIEKVEIQRRSYALAAELLRRKRLEVELGALAPIQIVEIESDVAARKTEITTALRDLQKAEIQLRNTLGLPQQIESSQYRVVPTDKASFREETFRPIRLLETALDNRPDFKKAKVQAESQGIQVEFSANQLLPDFEASGSYGFSHADPNKTEAYFPFDTSDRRKWEVGLKFTFPLYNRAAKSDFVSQKLTLMRLKAEILRVENTIRREVQDAIVTLRSNAQIYLESVEAAKLRERRLEAEEEKLKLGLSNIRDLLDAQTEVINAENAKLSAITDYEKALITLQKAIGIINPKLGVQLYNVRPELPPGELGR